LVHRDLHSSYLNAADGYVEGVVADDSDLKQAEAHAKPHKQNCRRSFQPFPITVYLPLLKGELITMQSKSIYMEGILAKNISKTLYARNKLMNS